MKLTDSHCHLDDKQLLSRFPLLLEQCAQLNIERIIVPSIAPSNFTQVLSLVKEFHQKPISLFACLGIHPWFLDHLTDADLQQLALTVERERNSIVAIGEIGVDGAISKRADNPEGNLSHQLHFFNTQLALAKQYHLPVIIHHRQSHQHIVPCLKQCQLNQAGVIHGFSGSYQQAKDYLDLGFKLGVGSTITYSRAKKTINTIKRLPLESLVLETDAPSMPLSPEVIAVNDITEKGGSPKALTNCPTYLPLIFNALCTIRDESPAEIAKQLEENVNQLLQISRAR